MNRQLREEDFTVMFPFPKRLLGKKLKPAGHKGNYAVLSAKEFHDQKTLIKWTSMFLRALVLTMLRGGFNRRGKKYIYISVSDVRLRHVPLKKKR